MIEYRRISIEEAPAVADFAIDGMGLSLHPGLRVSRDKVLAVVGHFVNSASDFQLAAFSGGRLVGAIAACVSEMLFFERCEATVVLCQARGVPGVGRELISALKRWADSDMRIRRVQFPEEIGARPGFARLLARYGFNQTQRVCVFAKR